MMYVGRVSVAKTACDEKGRPNTVPGPQYPPSNDSSMPSFLVALRYEMKFLPSQEQVHPTASAFRGALPSSSSSRPPPLPGSKYHLHFEAKFPPVNVTVDRPQTR